MNVHVDHKFTNVSLKIFMLSDPKRALRGICSILPKIVYAEHSEGLSGKYVCILYS